MLDKRTENVIEIAWVVSDLINSKKTYELPSEILKKLIVDFADKFESIYGDTDWKEKAYYDEIEKFAQEEFSLYFLNEFGDIPVTPKALI